MASGIQTTFGRELSILVSKTLEVDHMEDLTEKQVFEILKKQYDDMEEEAKVDMSAAAKKLTAAPKEKQVAENRYSTKAPQNTMGRVFSKLS